MTEYDAIIIGAGTSGLSIAALLGRVGYKTLVLEKQKFLGGRARTVQRNGFHLDYGIHSLRGSYKKVFRPLGMELHRARMPIQKGIIIEDRGILHKLPKVSSLFKAKSLKISDVSLLLRHLGSLVASGPRKYFNMSIKSWLNHIGASKRLENLFKLVSLALLVCPFLERASLGEFLFNLRHLDITGLGHPIGGFRQIHKALTWKVHTYGGTVELGKEVDEIVFENNKAIGVRVEGRLIHANIVVSSLPVQRLHTILDESLLEKNYNNFIKNLRPTAGISMDYGLSEKIFKEAMFLVPDPAVLGSITSNIDPSVAPKGKQLITFLNVLNVETMRKKIKRRKKLKQLENKIFSMFPQISDKIEWKRTLFLDMVDGVELNTRQTQDKRPDIQVPGISNLYIASDSTCAAGAGGDIAFNSAKLCFDRIVK